MTYQHSFVLYARQTAAVETEFERISRGMTHSEMVCSPKVREWVKRNKQKRYIPESVLNAMQITVNPEWV